MTRTGQYRIKKSLKLALSLFSLSFVLVVFPDAIFSFFQVPKIIPNNPCISFGNWDFQAGDLRCWIGEISPVSQISPEVVPVFADGENGSPFDSFSLRLGDAEGIGTSLLGMNGFVAVHRTYKVPTAGNPELRFDYLMYSYDITASSRFSYDTFEVAINNPSSIVWGTGNAAPQGSGCLRNVWQSNAGLISTASISLTQYVGQDIEVYFILRNQTDDRCNSWVYIDNVQVAEIAMDKVSDPPGPVHEGDTITYTISYTNTGLITQTTTVITDILPFNARLLSNSLSRAPTKQDGSTLVWNLGHVPPGESGHISFKVHVPLLPSLPQEPLGVAALAAASPAFVLPVSVACDTTRFWANGVTAQPAPPAPYTLQVQIPPGARPTEMWLLMKGLNHSPPIVGGQPALQVVTSTKSISASLWSAPITPTMTPGEQVTVITQNPRELNALFLFDRNDPPFNQQTLEDFFDTPSGESKIFTYTFDLPSVATQTVDVIMPFMDITHLTDSMPPQIETRLTTATMEFAGQQRMAVFNHPNLGNGLLMAQFLFDIGPLSDRITTTQLLTVAIDTDDSVYTLAPRLCRPVYIENTAWLCSEQAGCISDTATNLPENFSPPTIYLPIILKTNP